MLKTNFNRVIWLLWLQGWNTAPEIVKDIRESWHFHNHSNGWLVQSLDFKTLIDHIELSYFELRLPAPALSDIARLRLLSKYGGVWADATMLCMRPIDDWLDSALPAAGCGFWMHHGRDRGRGPASWFMVSNKSSYIASTWDSAAKEYWKSPKTDNQYFWMDRLFAEIIMNDEKFKQDWLSVPFLYCAQPFQAHCLAGKVFDNYDDVFKKGLYASSVPAVKLSHHNSCSLYAPGTNAWMAVEVSMDQSRTPPPIKWENPPSFSDARFFVPNERSGQLIQVVLLKLMNFLRFSLVCFRKIARLSLNAFTVLKNKTN